MSQLETNQPTATSTSDRGQEMASRISPILMRLAYPLFRYLVFPVYFRNIQVFGQERLPQKGAVILAPTHRSRWDALLVAYVTGRLVTGRDLRFMVTIDEMQGLQGWFLERLGCFPVNTHKSDIRSLRHAIDLLEQQNMLVIFPEGRIVEASEDVTSIRTGLSYVGLQAEEAQPGLNVQIVPISTRYSPPVPSWRSRAKVTIGHPLAVQDYCQKPMKDCAKRLRDDLQASLQKLHSQNKIEHSEI